jgi:hypothetical protein
VQSPRYNSNNAKRNKEIHPEHRRGNLEIEQDHQANETQNCNDQGRCTVFGSHFLTPLKFSNRIWRRPVSVRFIGLVHAGILSE